MPHIDVKLVGNPSDQQKKVVAEKIAKIIEDEFGKARKYISVSIEGKSFDEWSEVYYSEIKDNKNIVIKPQYTNPRTFQ
ncbi:MAG: tautomerase family protein [Christensenellaceae bacterium]|jgi:phenylpyruvate tautomerase PptA (4-oxalocrotonate tautomerase family)|nr:tautomerase family protein [Christensenellaceae bacterium]